MRQWLAAAALGCVVVIAAAIAASGVGSPSIPMRQGPGSSATHAQPSPSPTGTAGSDAQPSEPPPVPATAATDASPAPSDGSLVIWARGDLTREFAETVGALPQVVATAHVRSTTLGLVRSASADGTPRDVLSDGFRIPVGVAAIDPARYAATLPPGPEEETITDLAPGEALLSETGSRLRRIGIGGEVDLVSLPGLDVVSVVPDNMIGNAEIILHVANADDAGIDEDGTVYVRHDAAPGAQTAALIEQISALVPDDLTARIVNVAAGEPRRRAPLVLSLAQVKERFGEFAFRPRAGVRVIDIDPEFPRSHIVTADVPILGAVTCHRDIIADLRAALQRIDDAGLAGEIDPDRYAGCYYPRRISTAGDRLSHHSWGIALDINVDVSLPDLGPPPHPEVIAAFEAHGFRWGGDFLQPDNHHFEWFGLLEQSRVSSAKPHAIGGQVADR